MVPDALILAMANTGFGLSLGASWIGSALARRIGMLGMLAAFLAVQATFAPVPEGPVQRLYSATAAAIRERAR